MIGFVTARATFSSRRWMGRRYCKFRACFSILILVIDAASLVFILSKHVSMSEEGVPSGGFQRRKTSEKLFKFSCLLISLMELQPSPLTKHFRLLEKLVFQRQQFRLSLRERSQVQIVKQKPDARQIIPQLEGEGRGSEREQQKVGLISIFTPFYGFGRAWGEFVS
jgi:hypothetical protein